ncbi:MAG: hypothetical protein ABIF71_14075 [Planctomycetota bacterium]
MGTCIGLDVLKSFVDGTAGEAVKNEVVNHCNTCTLCLERLVTLAESAKAAGRNFKDEHNEVVKLAMGGKAAAAGDVATGRISDTDVNEVQALKDAIEEKKRKAAVPKAVSGPAAKARPKTAAEPRPKHGTAAEPRPQAGGPTRTPAPAGRQSTGAHPRVRKREQSNPLMALVWIGALLLLAFGGYMGYRVSQTSGAAPTYQESVDNRGQSNSVQADVNRQIVSVGKYLGCIATLEGGMTVETQKVSVGSNIFENKSVMLAGGGFACISLDKEVLVYVDGNTSFRSGVKDLSDPLAATIELTSGRIMAVIDPQAGPGYFRIKAGSTYIYGAGADVHVEVRGGSVTIATAGGTVQFRDGNGAEQSLGPQKMRTIGGNEAGLNQDILAWVDVKGVKYALAAKRSTAAARPAAGSGAAAGPTPVYEDKFEDTNLSDNWRVMNKGAWLSRQGTVVHSSSEDKGMLLWKAPQFTDCIITAVCKTSGEGALGLVVNYTNTGAIVFRWTIDGKYELVQIKGTEETSLATRTGMRPEVGVFIPIQVSVQGDNIMVEIRNNMVLRGTVENLTPGQVGLFVDRDPDAAFDGFAVQGTRPPEVRF